MMSLIEAAAAAVAAAEKSVDAEHSYPDAALFNYEIPRKEFADLRSAVIAAQVGNPGSQEARS
jgi:hypothetical protein